MKKILAIFGILLLLHSTGMAQTVTGTVSDESSGETLPGVNIILKGTAIGTSTNESGEYSLDVESLQDTLVASFVGFQTKEVPINRRTNIDISLSSAVLEGEEMVVIGYGSTAQQNVTGSISSVDEEDLDKGSISRPLDLLQGKVAGLQVVNAGGANPNGEIQFQLRGLSTLSGGREPLIVVDGVPGVSLETIDSDEIKSIDVLKGGSAAAIYGTRGTNGVVLVTTKEPTAGQLLLEFSSKLTTQKVTKEVENLSASQYRETIQNQYPDSWEQFEQGSSTDWFDQITRSPVSQDYNMAISGGTDQMNYRAALNYTSSKGLMKKNSNDQIQTKMFINQSEFDGRLDIEYRILYARINRELADDWVFQQAFRYNPTAPVYDAENEASGGYYRNASPFQYFNPVAMINERAAENQGQNFSGSMNASFDITNNLEASILGSLTQNSLEGDFYQTSYYPVALGTGGTAYNESSLNQERLLETNLNYQTTLGSHNIEAIAGYSYEENSYESLSAENTNFDTDIYGPNNLGAGYGLGRGTASMNSYKQTSKLIAFFGRAIYNFDEKYLLTGSIRYEGSTKFGVNHKWGYFPAVSAGWRINQEQFMSGIEWLDNLKLRAGFGITGNQGIDPYQSLELLNTGGRIYYQGQWINTYQPASNPNPDLKWEKKTEYNFGLDFGVLSSRLTGSIDYYIRRTSDLLYSYDVPVPPNVYGQTFANVGELQNKGIEVTLNISPIQRENFNWNSTLLYSSNQNKLVSFSDPSQGYELSVLRTGDFSTDIDTWTQRIVEGDPIGNFVAPIFTGFTEDGSQATYEDLNGDGTITEEDRVVVGNAFPDFQLSLSNSFNYKNWDLNFTLRGAFGHQILNGHRFYYENFGYLGQKNILESALDYPNFEGTVQYSDRWVEDADYVKLDNLELGYNFNTGGNIVRNARIYVNARQLLVLTGYQGTDPEIDIGGLDPGIDRYSYYPRTSTYTVGFEIDF